MRPIPDTPAYQRIADDLRRRILDGEFAPGSALPSLAELAKHYEKSDRTAYEATKVLMQEGLIHSRPGAPTLVRERPPSVRIVRTPPRESAPGSRWHGGSAAQAFEGDREAHSTPAVAPPPIAERLRIKPGERTMRTTYVFSVDGKPTHLATSWEPLSLTIGADVVLPEQGPYARLSVPERMALIGHPPDLAVEDLVPRVLTGPEATKLGLRAGIPVIVIERTYWQGDLPLETADIVIPPPYRPSYEIPMG